MYYELSEAVERYEDSELVDVNYERVIITVDFEYFKSRLIEVKDELYNYSVTTWDKHPDIHPYYSQIIDADNAELWCEDNMMEETK